MKGTIHYDHDGREATPVDEEHGGHDMTVKLTEGGFHSIELELEPTAIAHLVNEWARENLHGASLELYTEVMTDTGNQLNALHGAVVNDMILVVLKEKLDSEEAKLDASSKDV